MSELELDPLLLETLRTLERHGVEFVLVGDVADAIYDHGGFVAGIAIVPAAYGRNVERLRGALEALGAELGAGDHRALDLRELAPCTFATRHADVAVDFEPSATRGYRELFDDADRIALAPGVRPLVAAPQDLERIERGAAPPAPFAQAPPPRAPAPPDDDRDRRGPQPMRYAAPPAMLPPEPDDGRWGEQQIRAARTTRRGT